MHVDRLPSLRCCCFRFLFSLFSFLAFFSCPRFYIPLSGRRRTLCLFIRYRFLRCLRPMHATKWSALTQTLFALRRTFIFVVDTRNLWKMRETGRSLVLKWEHTRVARRSTCDVDFPFFFPNLAVSRRLDDLSLRRVISQIVATTSHYSVYENMNFIYANVYRARFTFLLFERFQ